MLLNDRNLQETLRDEYQEVVHRVDGLVARVDAATLNRRPAEDAWSAAECLDHLNATARLYLPALAEAIEDGRARGLTGGRPDGRTLLGRIIAWAMEPPPRLKMDTFGELEPTADRDPAALAEEFASLHGDLVAQMKDAADLDRKRIKVRSRLDSRLKLSLDDWYAFIAAHARRHLWQAEKALESLA